MDKNNMFKLDNRRYKLIRVIGNVSRLKIFLALWKSKDDLSVYKICRKTGLKRERVHYHLHKLIDIQLVMKKVYGVVPLYTINQESSEANALIDFFIKTRF